MPEREQERGKHVTQAIFEAWEPSEGEWREMLVSDPEKFTDRLDLVASIAGVAGAIGLTDVRTRSGSGSPRDRRTFDLLLGSHPTSAYRELVLGDPRILTAEVRAGQWKDSKHVLRSFYEHMLGQKIPWKAREALKLRLAQAWHKPLNATRLSSWPITPKHDLAQKISSGLQSIVREVPRAVLADEDRRRPEILARRLKRASGASEREEILEEARQRALGRLRTAISRAYDGGRRMRRNREYAALLGSYGRGKRTERKG